MSPLFPYRFLRFNYPNSTTRVVGRQEGDTAVVGEGCRKLEGESLSAGRATPGAGRAQSRGERASGGVWFVSRKGRLVQFDVRKLCWLWLLIAPAVAHAQL